MTTSSENQIPVKSRPSGDHWFEMTATLSIEETAQFGDWMSASLNELEASLQHFASPQSRGESISRR
jgi:hypothetical protein